MKGKLKQRRKGKGFKNSKRFPSDEISREFWLSAKEPLSM
jgi:hypothetical protein